MSKKDFYFQFSLWDSFYLYCTRDYAFALSILFMRFDDFSIYIPFIIYFFQFSLWDSQNRLSSLSGVNFILSILFMRFLCWSGICHREATFNSLYEIHVLGENVWYNLISLSILFMRFVVPKSVIVADNIFFQFSLWDSVESENDLLILDVNFQFSLWDSEMKMRTIGRLGIILSILFMRFKEQKKQQLQNQDFQFSLWDSRLKLVMA